MKGDSTESKLLQSTIITMLLLASITAGGMGIRFYRLADRSIWYDESSSWRMSQAPLPLMMSRIISGSHPPLHYFVLRLWTEVFGDSLWAMRGLSVVLAGATIVGVYLFLCEALQFSHPSMPRSQRRWIGLFAAALVATSLLQIRMSWEARMYTLGTALLAHSSWALFRALRSARFGPDWVSYVVLTLLFLYTHYYALFSVAAQVLFVAGFLLHRAGWSPMAAAKDQLFRRATLAYGIVAAGWSIWLPVFLRQRSQIENHWWTPPFELDFVPQAFSETFLGTSDNGDAHVVGSMIVLACAGVLVGTLWRGQSAAWYSAILASLPIGLCILASLLGRNILVVRYLVFADLFFLVSLALLVGRVRAIGMRNLLAGILLATGGAIDIEYWNSLNVAAKPGVKGAVGFIESKKRPAEKIIVVSPLVYYPALYHSQDRPAWRVYNPGGDFAYFAGGAIAAPQDFIYPGEIDGIKSGSVWVVVGGWGRESMPIPRNWRPEFTRQFQEVYGFQGIVRVTRYRVEKARENRRDTN